MRSKGLTLCCLFTTLAFGLQAQETIDQPNNRPNLPRVTLSLPDGKAAAIPNGPFQASWASVEQNYKVPDWFLDAKFGIFIHYGVYTVAAHASEWYPRHMYSNAGVQKWHEEHFGRVDTFGYKDLIPMLNMEKFNASQWAELFKKSGARYVVPTAEHHDGFAMYESNLTRWNAMDMGPHIDFIGELGKAVRNEGLKFGVSNHRMENWDFMYPQLNVKTDLFDPRYADFYGPPQKPAVRKAAVNGEEVLEDQAKADQSEAFQEEWLARCQELVDKYQPDLFWFDNGVNSRQLDSIKLRFAAYYYNRAREWGKAVSISTKSDAYLAGSIRDFERQGRAPKEKTDYIWQVDDPIGEKFGYVEGMKLTNSGSIIRKLVENVCRNGNYMLNISPKSDGTIPEEQQQILLGVGNWLHINGEGIYGTRAWTTEKEGPFRFTTKGNALYAISLEWSEKPLTITLLPSSAGKIKKITLLGYQGKITFTQDAQGLKITFPKTKPCDVAYTFKIEGVITPTATTADGLAHLDFFYAGEAKKQNMYVVKNGKVTWSYTHPAEAGEISDAVLLSNGNILFAHQFGITEITPSKKVVWNYDAPKGTETHTAMPIGKDKVLFLQNGNPAKLIVMNKNTNQILKELQLPVGNPDKIHGHFRHARLTKSGTILVAHLDMGRLCEYNSDGKQLFSIDVPGIWSAEELANGHILVTSKEAVREIDRQQTVYWEYLFSSTQPYGITSPQTAIRLKNGNTIVNNWFNQWSGNGTVDLANQPIQAIELAPDKHVVWALHQWQSPDLGPSTIIIPLSEPHTNEHAFFGPFH
jgi:alpha-L-fucosidase